VSEPRDMESRTCVRRAASNDAGLLDYHVASRSIGIPNPTVPRAVDQYDAVRRGELLPERKPHIFQIAARAVD
jgi:hypothetical protein